MAYYWQTWLADALRAEGCNVAEDCGDWKHRGRPSSSGSFDPYGVLMHHTGSPSSTSNPFPTKNTLINGRPDLSGPLCQVGIDYNGVCHMIAAGRANHGGEHSGFGPFPTGDCNAMMIGFEIDYDGTQMISDAQIDAAIHAGAAVLKHKARDVSYCERHEESSVTGKWDTGHVTGDQWRQWINDYIQEGDMPTAAEIAAAVWGYKINTGWQADGTYGDSSQVAMSKVQATAYGEAVQVNNGMQPQPVWTMAPADVEALAADVHRRLPRDGDLSFDDVKRAIKEALAAIEDEARQRNEDAESNPDEGTPGDNPSLSATG